MLQSFNDRLKGPFTWVIVIGISIIFVVTGMGYFFANVGSSGSYAAKVGDEEISINQFQRYAANATTKQDKMQVLSYLVDQYMFIADADRQHIDVSTLSLQSAIFSDPIFFGEDGKFSSDKLNQIAKNVGGMANLEAMISQNVKATIIPRNISITSFMTKSEDTTLEKLYSVNKNINYLMISPKTIESSIKPTDNQLTDYFAKHSQEYVAPATAKIQYTVVSKDDFIDGVKVTDAQIKTYYDNNMDLFTSFDATTKASITKILKNRQALQNYQQFIQSIDSQIYQKLSANKNVTFKTADLLDNSLTTISGIPNAVFFERNDKYGVVPASDSQTVVYQILNKTKSHNQSLSEVKAKVSQNYIAEQSIVEANKQAVTSLTNLQAGNKLSVKLTNADVDRNTTNLPKGFVDEVLSNGNNQYYEYQDANNDIYIYKVAKVTSSDTATSKAPAEVVNAFKNSELEYYLATIDKQIPVKINNSIL